MKILLISAAILSGCIQSCITFEPPLENPRHEEEVEEEVEEELEEEQNPLIRGLIEIRDDEKERDYSDLTGMWVASNGLTIEVTWNNVVKVQTRLNGNTLYHGALETPFMVPKCGYTSLKDTVWINFANMNVTRFERVRE